jgi:hypothetical protein
VTDPVGCISLAEQYLRQTLAASETFRSAVGAGNPAAALAHIYTDDLPPPAGGAATYSRSDLETLRPFAVVWTEEQDGLRRQADAVSDARNYGGSGRLAVLFEQDVPSQVVNDPPEASRRFKNTLGLIIDEMLAVAGTPDYLDIAAITLRGGPTRSHPDAQATEGDFLAALLSVEWRN